MIWPRMGPSMQPSPLAVEQNPKYSIFYLGNRMVMALYPAIERAASPKPSKALRTNAIPTNQSLCALKFKEKLTHLRHNPRSQVRK